MSSVAWQRARRMFLERDYEYVLEGAKRAGLPEGRRLFSDGKS